MISFNFSHWLSSCNITSYTIQIISSGLRLVFLYVGASYMLKPKLDTLPSNLAHLNPTK